MKTKIKKKKNPETEIIKPDYIITDINVLISELEDLKSVIRQPSVRELKASFKNINGLSEKVLNKLVKRIKDETGLG